jgi:diguanylate cyclase (GGDEF)-like protein
VSETGLLVSLALAVALGLPAWLLERASVRRPADRTWLAPLALGATLELLSRTAPVVHDATGWPGLEVAGEGLALAAPVLLLVGLVLAVRQRMRGVRINVLIDGLAGALAGACVAALVLAPLADRVWDGSWQSGVALGRPLLTSTLSAAAVGALSLLGTDHLARFGAWAAGTTVLAGADIAAAAWPAQPLWAGVFPLLALALVAAGAHVATAEQELRLPGPRSLGVPATAATVAVATLAVAPQWSVTAVPSVLALVTLAVSTVRFVRVFLQLRELAAIREQALTDELTGIANRRALYLHLDGLLAPKDGEDHAEPEFAVALIDLDHFKEVNDTLGHATGDALLKGVVGRFAAALEELETPHLLARLGGDEFAVVLHEATTRNAALIVGEALAASLAEPLELPDTSLHAQASIGLAAAPLHGRTRGELLFAADAAMYAAKTSGDSVRFHAPKVDEKTQQLGVAEDLYQALERHELFVEYQPVRTVGGELVGVEALVRWQHPERGRLEPGDFLEAAERYRLTGAIAERVLDIALGDLACWRAEGVPLTLTVNLSIADLRDEAIVSTVANALLAHRLPAKVLTLDIGEAGLAADLDRVKGVVTALHDLGVRLSLDDYGTGGTSLTALMALPLDAIKIDRRFVRDAAINPRLGGIVRATVDLTHALGLGVVAEGVEDRTALELLAGLGCDLVQGWHVGRPMDAMGIERLLAQPTGGKHRLHPDGPTVPDQPTADSPHAVPPPSHAGPHRQQAADGLTSSPS